MASEHKELSDQDELIADLLGQGWTHRRVADLVGVSSQTVQRRMSDPAFSMVVSERRRERFGGQLLTAGKRAMDLLTGALQADDPKVSLQAAGLILSHGHRATTGRPTTTRPSCAWMPWNSASRDEAVACEALLGEGASGSQRCDGPVQPTAVAAKRWNDRVQQGVI